MIVSRNWSPGDVPLHYLYSDTTGRIVGETCMVGMSVKSKFTATIYPNTMDTISLGMYISSETAKSAIERYWHNQDSVYDNVGTILENKP